MTIAAKGIVHISLGRDEDESGAVQQKSTNEWRLEQALKYKEHQCPVQVRIIADITIPMNTFHKKVYEQMGGSQFILLTPLHYTNKKHFADNRSDITWDEAKKQNLFTYSSGDLRPNIIHPDWKVTKERCGMIAGKESCNNCLRKITFNKQQYKQQLTQLGWGMAV